MTIKHTAATEARELRALGQQLAAILAGGDQ